MDIIFDCSTFAMYDSYINDIYVSVHLARLNLFYTFAMFYTIAIFYVTKLYALRYNHTLSK